MIPTIREEFQPMLATPVDMMEIARRYVTTQIGAAFTLTKPRLLYEKNVWWALIQYQATGARRPIGVGQLQINRQTGAVIPLTPNEIQTVREKAVLLEAKQRSRLPVDARGLILKEFARKQASRYLWEYLGMYYGAAEPILTPGDPPVWQVTIFFKLYEQEPIRLGVMAVDAQSGEPIPLTEDEIKQIKERVHVIVGHQTPATNPS